MLMNKIDYKKLISSYNSSSTPQIVDVPKMNYLKIVGIGSPKEVNFQEAAGILFPLAYTIKFMLKKECDLNYAVMPMEVQWRVIHGEKKSFNFSMMIMQPECVTEKIFKEACEKVAIKNKGLDINKVEFVTIDEGKCIQILHKGPYDQMNKSLESMINYAKENNLKLRETNTHDIYLNNVNKTLPINLKTIMRLQLDESL